MPETSESAGLPRGYVFWRTVYETERRLGTLPMVIVTPIVVGVAGTVWAVSHPSEVMRGGAVVLVRQSFPDVLLNALVGGVAGVLTVIGLVFVGAWASYRVRGDRTWEAIYGDTAQPGPAYGPHMCFEFHRRGPIPIDPRTVGAVGCSVKTPSGMVWASRGGELRERHNPEGLIAMSPLEPEPGRYEVYWYAAEGKPNLHEIARVTLSVDGDGVVTELPRVFARLRGAWRRELERENRLRAAASRDPR